MPCRWANPHGAAVQGQTPERHEAAHERDLQVSISLALLHRTFLRSDASIVPTPPFSWSVINTGYMSGMFGITCSEVADVMGGCLSTLNPHHDTRGLCSMVNPLVTMR